MPRNLTITGRDPATVTIQPALGTLSPDIYRGAMTLLFADGSPAQTVNVLFVVVPPASPAAGLAMPDGTSAALSLVRLGRDCEPQRLFAVFRSLSHSFASPVGWPTLIETQVVDDCGNPVSNASVTASFSNGDAPVPLVPLQPGVYAGTWRPTTARPQVTVALRIARPPLTPAELTATGQVSANPGAPVLFSGGVVNGASFARGGAVAPGAIVSVFGRSLAAGQSLATSLPLGTTLGGATLIIGGREAPLFFASDGQINAQIPLELPPNIRAQALIRTRRGDGTSEAVTVPETITVAPALPGIFSTNQQGTEQGAILGARGLLVDSSAAASAGDHVQVFCTGLGVTTPAVRSGQPAPASPLAHTAIPVEAQIGGRPATVHFSGLAPGFVGLYQVNVEVPRGVAPGPRVPLVILQNGIASNTVTLAIR